MLLPSRNEAERYLLEAERMNPGDWIQHSVNTALCAEKISEYHLKLNGESAYILGLLHDIGRREGKTYIRHTIDGYNFLVNEGFPDAARICITHAFHYNDINAMYSKLDYNECEYNYVNNFLQSLEMDEYDYLIQLCDCLALSSGFCLLEKRMVDAALRYGTNNYTVMKWKKIFEIKEYFEKTIGFSVYKLLLGVIENTFI